MKAAFKTLLGLAIVFGLILAVNAEDKKEAKKELKGEVGCPKCVFKLDKKITGGKCGNAIKVKEGDKEVIYVFIDMGGKEKYHKSICTASHKGSVTGVVSKKDDQNYITPEKDSVKIEE